MSYDPYASGSELPPEYGPAGATPGGPQRIKSRLQAPAIALIVAGVLNLFLAVLPALQAFQMAQLSPAQFEEAMAKQNPQGREQIKQLGWKTESMLLWFTRSFAIWAIVDFLASFLVILGGILMLNLKSYGLAVLASLLAALPLISCTGCCGLGEVAGLWALVVLLNAEVRSAFQ